MCLKNSRKVICLCGAIATGKSTVAEVWKGMGIEIISADKVGHRILQLSDVKQALVERFGKEILEGGEVVRKRLAERVFGDRDALSFLNRLTHPLIKAEIGKILRKKNGIVVIEAALLFEIGLDEYCDIIIATYCSREEQIRRLIRKGFSRRQAIKRIDSQRKPEFCRDKAHIVINTQGSIEYVRKTAIEIINQIQEGKWAPQEVK